MRVSGSGEEVLVLQGLEEPTFSVSGLAPGTEYVLAVAAANAHGTAPPFAITH